MFLTYYRLTYVRPGLLILLASCQTLLVHSAPPEVSQQNGFWYATCKMQLHSPPAEGSPTITGVVGFKQECPVSKLKVLVYLKGFSYNDTAPKKLHIHQYGDLTDGCTSTGAYYNPRGVDHPNHPGDLGDVIPHNGTVFAKLKSRATLFGKESVIGRAVVLLAGRDELGVNKASRLDGNAGLRVGCCVIGIAIRRQPPS